jgi:hypothetical protein
MQHEWCPVIGEFGNGISNVEREFEENAGMLTHLCITRSSAGLLCKALLVPHRFVRISTASDWVNMILLTSQYATRYVGLSDCKSVLLRAPSY